MLKQLTTISGQSVEIRRLVFTNGATLQGAFTFAFNMTK